MSSWDGRKQSTFSDTSVGVMGRTWAVEQEVRSNLYCKYAEDVSKLLMVVTPEVSYIALLVHVVIYKFHKSPLLSHSSITSVSMMFAKFLSLA